MKSKKILTILLSLAIMMTFMPTMAFAAQGPTSTGGHEWIADGTSAGLYTVVAGEYMVDSTFPGLEVLVAPTCTEFGVGTIPCVKDLNDEKCTNKRTVFIKMTGHDTGNKVKKTPADMMDYLGYSNAAKANWYKTNTGTENDFCYGYVYVCKDCGRWLDENKYLVDSVNDVFDIRGHLAPSGLADCAESFTCAEPACGREKVTDGTHKKADGVVDGDATDVAKHKYTSTSVKVHDNGSKYVTVTTMVCADCNKTVKKAVATPEDATFEHTKTSRKVVTEATCSAPGTEQIVCDDCDAVIETNQIKQLAHSYVAKTALGNSAVFYNARITKDADGNTLNGTYTYAYNQCGVCDAIDPTSVKLAGFAPSSTMTFELAAPATCEQGAWIVGTSTNGSRTHRFIVNDFGLGYFFQKIGDKYYFNGNKDYEIPFAPAKGHKWSATKALADATCTESAMEGRTCSDCNEVDHGSVSYTGAALGHTVEEVVVPATCGEGGYTYKVCTTCNQYFTDKAAKNTSKSFLDAYVYDETKPVVSLGTKCQYEWKTLEEATPFKLGTRAKVCTVCGDELAATKESVAKTTIAAPAVKSLKKKAKVTVKAVDGAVKYQILVNGKVSKTVTKAGKFTVKKYVKAGKKNTFKIRAINADGVKATSKAKTVKIKKK